MPKRKYIPRVGTIFESRDELQEKLVESGWEFEGCSTSKTNTKGKITGFGLGVRDEKTDQWLIIEMKPHYDGVRVTKVKRLKISDYEGR